MKLCRFDDDRLGLVQGDRVRDVTAALACLPQIRYPLPGHDPMIAHLGTIRAAIEALPSGPARPMSEVRLQSPVANPGKLVAAPSNFASHLAEALGDAGTFSPHHARPIHETGLFLKATSSLVGAGAPIEIRHPERRTDHEIELAVVIGRSCRDVPEHDALACVAGYAIGLDITIRGAEERSLRKSLDTYSVLGPCLVTADEFGDPAGRELLLSVDGIVKQRANTRDMIMSVSQLIAFVSTYYTLHPGDVLFTGTPDGVGPIRPGEIIEASIAGIGTMAVGVIAM